MRRGLLIDVTVCQPSGQHEYVDHPQKALSARYSVRSPVIRVRLVDFWLTPVVEHSFAFMESRPFVALLLHRWYLKTATIQLRHFLSDSIYITHDSYSYLVHITSNPAHVNIDDHAEGS